MAITWSKEQRQVIDLRDRNILVSAAAGSGKTAVLVERILQRITTDQPPVDIDRLLVVTFTNAAAAEMRERIAAAIETRMLADPQDNNLQRQLTLVHHAQITTIDSFCLYVVHNYFHKIQLEPGFRVADEGEMELLKSDVLDQVLEQYYKEENPDFLAFSDNYGSAKNDQAIRSMILQLYTYSQSYPWPKQWLAKVQQSYEIEDSCQMEQSAWMQSLLEYLKHCAAGLCKEMEQCLMWTQDADGPAMYQAAVESDVEQLQVLAQAQTFPMFSERLGQLSFARLGSSRKYEGSIEKKELVQETRNTVKKAITDMKEQFFFLPLEQMQEKMQKTAPYVRTLVSLVQAFGNAFDEKKREKNIIDFNDMEHFALQILVNEETGEPTDTAREFQELFAEIMIDEYQDSNYVQETILNAISRVSRGEYNIFMVGDVKQSIYRFRLARPELFMEKFDTYQKEDGEKQRIDLHKNFRSRKEIVQTVNDVFTYIMKKDLGKVEYDEEAALYQGAEFPEASDPNMYQTELLLLDKEEVENTVEAGASKYEMEARVTAARIKELMRTQKVNDSDTKQLRPLRYSDIVILFRSLSGCADTFVEVLTREGIPAHTESKTGYFSAIEVQTILNVLRVIDNPRQDIPLAAVLTSPIVGMDGESLAKIKAAYENAEFYQAAAWYAQGYDEKEGTCTRKMPDEKLQERLQAFWKQMQYFRTRSVYRPIHLLLEEVLQVTGYEEYVAALPAGVRKQANLRMLVEKAIAYEGTSYRGLFHFIRYIEKLQKYSVDFGEAELSSEADDTVRIMSIHKSKGLEFPVVFLGAAGKSFNKQDLRSKLILHPELGVGLDYIDGERRTKTPTLLKKVLAKQTDLENMGEELRILYVALTRAKERLILTATVKEADKKLETQRQEAEIRCPGSSQSFFKRAKATSYLEWILPVFAANQVRYHIRRIVPDALERQEETDAVNVAFLQEQFRIKMEQKVPEAYEEVEKRLAYRYPYEKEIAIKTKVSVSEQKKAGIRQMEEESSTEQRFDYEKMDVEERIPNFLKEEIRENRAAKRGSAFHRAMECLDFTTIYAGFSEKRLEEIQDSYEENKEESLFSEKEWKILYRNVSVQLEKCREEGRLPDEMYELLYKKQIVDFFTTLLALRMAKAAKCGMLKREKAFVMGIPAKELYPETESEELVLVQGIIDGFFEENGSIIVMDYKTDRLDEPQQFVERYQEQLHLYARALERITQKQVTEELIYAVRKKQAICCEIKERG